MAPRHHVVITGTGRAGTTFLVELLTHLGLDTGFEMNSVEQKKDRHGRAGLEHDIRNPNCPFVVKSPWFCDYAEEVIFRNDILVEHIFIPVRNLNAAAESRRFVTKTGSAAGALWHTNSSDPGIQEDVLLRQIYKLILAVSDTEIPITLIRYPKLTNDAQYLYRKLNPIVKDISFERFHKTFNAVVRPELVHSFNESDC